MRDLPQNIAVDGVIGAPEARTVLSGVRLLAQAARLGARVNTVIGGSRAGGSGIYSTWWAAVHSVVTVSRNQPASNGSHKAVRSERR